MPAERRVRLAIGAQVNGRMLLGEALEKRPPVAEPFDGVAFDAELARGLVAYNLEEARLLVGRRTVEIETILGYRGRDEMIHRDDLALTGSAGEEQ